MPVSSSYSKTPERVDITARVHVDTAELRLFGTHVQGVPTKAENWCRPFVGQVAARRLSHAKVDHFGDWLAVIRHQHLLA